MKQCFNILAILTVACQTEHSREVCRDWSGIATTGQKVKRPSRSPTSPLAKSWKARWHRTGAMDKGSRNACRRIPQNARDTKPAGANSAPGAMRGPRQGSPPGAFRLPLAAHPWWPTHWAAGNAA